MEFIKKFYFIFICFSNLALGTTKEHLNLNQIKDFYNNIQIIDAKIIQEKTADYLFMPLKSTIQMHGVKGKEVQWNIIEPVPMKILLQGENISIDGTKNSITPAAFEQFKEIINIVRALTTADFTALDKSFDLVVQGEHLLATPKKLVQFPYTISIEFKNDLSINEIIMSKSNETIKLSFKSFVTSK